MLSENQNACETSYTFLITAVSQMSNYVKLKGKKKLENSHKFIILIIIIVLYSFLCYSITSITIENKYYSFLFYSLIIIHNINFLLNFIENVLKNACLLNNLTK
ncbi:hypothetical protein QTP88_008755 [Uroleucon formosanum]